MTKHFYVLGSGPTVGLIHPSFYDGEHVVATNLVGERLGLYDRAECQTLLTHSHYHEDTYRLAESYPQYMFWTPQGDRGFEGKPGRTDLPNVFHYPHKPTEYDFTVAKAWPDNPTGLVVGSTSVHGSIHLACKFGATHIILVGVDCGMLDGQVNQHGYLSGNLAANSPMEWLKRWELHLRQVTNRIQQEYEVRIHSLNPFLNLNLEGHKWQGVDPT
jgi:hypothetical protein